MLFSAVNKVFDVVMIGLIIMNLMMMKNRYGQKKRFSTILVAFIFLGFYFLLALASAKELPAWADLIAVAFVLLMVIVLRKRLFLYTFRCRKCGKLKSIREFFAYDDNLCENCWREEHPEESKKEDEKYNRKNPRMKSEEDISAECAKANTISEVPWSRWEPTERCVLVYTFDALGNVLLIHKKRGLGNGYINAPGGHIELEETKTEAAVREVKEETGLTIWNLKEMGTLHFQFKDGLRMLGYVFTTHDYKGEIFDECDETKPFWGKVKEIDYTKMWADDPLWLPLMLEGKKFDAYFLFDDRTLLDHKVEVLDDEE